MPVDWEMVDATGLWAVEPVITEEWKLTLCKSLNKITSTAEALALKFDWQSYSMESLFEENVFSLISFVEFLKDRKFQVDEIEQIHSALLQCETLLLAKLVLRPRVGFGILTDSDLEYFLNFSIKYLSSGYVLQLARKACSNPISDHELAKRLKLLSEEERISFFANCASSFAFLESQSMPNFSTIVFSSVMNPTDESLKSLIYCCLDVMNFQALFKREFLLWKERFVVNEVAFRSAVLACFDLLYRFFECKVFQCSALLTEYSPLIEMCWITSSSIMPKSLADAILLHTVEQWSKCSITSEIRLRVFSMIIQELINQGAEIPAKEDFITFLAFRNEYLLSQFCEKQPEVKALCILMQLKERYTVPSKRFRDEFDSLFPLRIDVIKCALKLLVEKKKLLGLCSQEEIVLKYLHSHFKRCLMESFVPISEDMEEISFLLNISFL